MVKVSKRQHLRKMIPRLRKAGWICFTHSRRIKNVQVSEYEFETYSCLIVPNAPSAKEVEILYLKVRHEIDFPCRWIKGQVIEIDRERSEWLFLLFSTSFQGWHINHLSITGPMSSKMHYLESVWVPSREQQNESLHAGPCCAYFWWTS